MHVTSDSVRARSFDPELIERELEIYLRFIDGGFIHRELQPQAAGEVLSPEQEARLRARIEDVRRQLQEVLAEEHGVAPQADTGEANAAEGADFDYRSASVEEQVMFIDYELSTMVVRVTVLQREPWVNWRGDVPPLVLAGETQAKLEEYLQFIDGALRLQVVDGELEPEVVDELRARAEDVRWQLAEVLAAQPASRVNLDEVMRLTAGLTASFLQDVRADYLAAAEAGDRARLEAGLQQLEDWEETVPLSPEDQGRVESLQDRIRQELGTLPPAAGGEQPTEEGMHMTMLGPDGVAATAPSGYGSSWPQTPLILPGFRPPLPPDAGMLTLVTPLDPPELPTQLVFTVPKRDTRPLIFTPPAPDSRPPTHQQATPAARTPRPRPTSSRRPRTRRCRPATSPATSAWWAAGSPCCTASSRCTRRCARSCSSPPTPRCSRRCRARPPTGKDPG